MPRFLITDLFPNARLPVPDDALVIAPHSGVRRVLGVSTRDLHSIAKELLKRNGFGIATPIQAAHALIASVTEVSGRPNASSVARHFRETVGTILRSGIDLEKLTRFGSDRARQAAEITLRYREILARQRLVDSDGALATALEHDLVKPQKVFVYGYFRGRQFTARREEFELIDRIAGEDSVFYLPAAGVPIFSVNLEWIGYLRSRGWEIGDQPGERVLDKGTTMASVFAGLSNEKVDADAIEYTDVESEVRGVLAKAKAEALSGTHPGRIAIVCRNIHLYAKSLISVAREYQLPIDIDCEVDLGETDLGAFIELLVNVLERRGEDDIKLEKSDDNRGFQYEPTLRLLLHRLGPGLSDEQRAFAYRTRPDSFEDWMSITSEVEKLQFEGEMTAEQWIDRLRKVLFDWELRGHDKLGRSATGIEAFDKFFDSIEQVARERDMSPISADVFAMDVADVLANIKTSLHAEHGGVKVLLPNVAVGAEFDRMFVIGLAEGILPSPSSDSPVIDFHERERLREHGVEFENALEVPRWEALTFYFTLLACRGDIAFSYPKFAGDGETIESSYFKRLGVKPRRSDDAYVSSTVESRRVFLTHTVRSGDEVLTFAQRQFDVEKGRESAAPPDEYDGVIGIPVHRYSWSASSLARIGSCPFKWFAHDVLRLNEPAEADTELQPNVRGNLLHKTLEIAANHGKGSTDTRKLMLDALEEAFAEAETLHSPLLLVTNWHLRRTEQFQKLERAIVSDEFIDEGAVIVETEKAFEAELCGLKIKGVIDRIDKCSDGKILAIDYKHGSYLGKIKDEDGMLRVEIQLAIYLAVALPGLYPNTSVGGRFFHLADPSVTKGKEVDLERALQRIRSLLETGSFAVDPDIKKEACLYCGYDAVCRVGPRVDLKREHL
jgi:ATP-dependent helicase/DNAse subunit B